MTLLDYTEAEAIAEGALLLPTVDVKRHKGAKCDLRVLRDGSIAAGGFVLTSPSTSFTAADVGKVVNIPNAGAADTVTLLAGGHGNGTIVSTVFNVRKPLTTPIVSVSGHTATLAAASQVTFTGTAMAWYGTDDTAAIQAASDDIATDGGGNIFIPGYSMVAGPLQDTSGANCQILLHPLYQNEEPITYILHGSRFPSMGYWGTAQHQGRRTGGIYSPLWAKDAVGAHPTIIGSTPWAGDPGQSIRFSTAQLLVRDFGFKGTNGSAITRLQYRFGGNLIFDNVNSDYDVDVVNLSAPVDANPTFAWPAVSNNAINECRNLYVIGGHTALQVGEHFHASGACSLGLCVVGVKLEGNGWPLPHMHGAHFDRLLCQRVAKFLTAIDGATVVTIPRLEAENVGPDDSAWPWTNFQGNLQEDFNYCFGRIDYSQFTYPNSDGVFFQMTPDSTSNGQTLNTLNLAQRAPQEGIAYAAGNVAINASDTWFDIITFDMPAGKYWLDAGVRFYFDATPSGSFSQMIVRILDDTGAVAVPHTPTMLYSTDSGSPSGVRIVFQGSAYIAPAIVNVAVVVGAVAQRRYKLQALRQSSVGSVVWGNPNILHDTGDAQGQTWLRYRPFVGSH